MNPLSQYKDQCKAALVKVDGLLERLETAVELKESDGERMVDMLEKFGSVLDRICKVNERLGEQVGQVLTTNRSIVDRYELAQLAVAEVTGERDEAREQAALLRRQLAGSENQNAYLVGEIQMLRHEQETVIELGTQPQVDAGLPEPLATITQWARERIDQGAVLLVQRRSYLRWDLICVDLVHRMELGPHMSVDADVASWLIEQTRRWNLQAAEFGKLAGDEQSWLRERVCPAEYRDSDTWHEENVSLFSNEGPS